MVSKSELVKLSESSRQSVRARIGDLFSSLEEKDKIDLVFVLLRSVYRDMQRFALDCSYCADFSYSPLWIEKLECHFQTGIHSGEDDVLELLIILVARLMPLERDRFRDYLYETLKSKNLDVRYQSIVALELSELSGDDYVKLLEGLLGDEDSEVRIVASQGLVRLGSKGSLGKIREAWSFAFGDEAFHLLLARAELGEEGLSDRLCRYLDDSRYCYPAIVALKAYGDSSVVDALLVVARSWFGEATLKVAAADAACSLGSKEGLEILRKAAKKRSGNPYFARECLKSYGYEVEEEG